MVPCCFIADVLHIIKPLLSIKSFLIRMDFITHYTWNMKMAFQKSTCIIIMKIELSNCWVNRDIENFSCEWWKSPTKLFRHQNADSGEKNHEPSEKNGQKDNESTLHSAVITDDDHALLHYVTNDWWYSILIRVIKRWFIISQWKIWRTVFVEHTPCHECWLSTHKQAPLHN